MTVILIVFLMSCNFADVLHWKLLKVILIIQRGSKEIYVLYLSKIKQWNVWRYAVGKTVRMSSFPDEPLMSSFTRLHRLSLQNVLILSSGSSRERASPPSSEHPGGGLPSIWSLHPGGVPRCHQPETFHLQHPGQDLQQLGHCRWRIMFLYDCEKSYYC